MILRTFGRPVVYRVCLERTSDVEARGPKHAPGAPGR